MPQDLSGRYRAKHWFIDGHKRHRPGTEIELSHKDAERALAQGLVQELGAEAPEPDQGAQGEPTEPAAEQTPAEDQAAQDAAPAADAPKAAAKKTAKKTAKKAAQSDEPSDPSVG